MNGAPMGVGIGQTRCQWVPTVRAYSLWFCSIFEFNFLTTPFLEKGCPWWSTT